MMTSGTVLSPEQVRMFALDVLRALGMPDDDASITAESMVWAGLRGSTSHSLARLDQIANRAEGGGLSLTADWTPVREHGNTTLMDAGYGWGIVAGTYGMRRAIDKAREFGIGVTSVRNCDVTSIMGWYAWLAAETGMIGLAVNNGAPLMAAWGGAGKLIGNQAFSIACPADRHPPLVLDMGIGAASLGVLNDALSTGAALPPGIAVDASGVPTTDARAWRDGGALLPMGGHRGFGLALMWEVLTGVLSGGSTLTELNPPNIVDKRAGSCLFLLAIEPAAFLPREEFLARVDRLIDQLHDSPAEAGVDRVRVPGEKRARLTEVHEHDGIPFPGADVAKLRALAERLGVQWPA
jgi:LDH2 family malate/lactate/ureidoglycolate dehydrogenase